jgi:hypothetical protein
MLALALLTGCVSQPNTTNPFDAQADFAAQRELETIVIKDMDGETACTHVTEVLMDLECAFREIDSTLGVISATTLSRMVQLGQADFFSVPIPRWWRACGGSNVTVSVKERDDGDVSIRAAFEPSKPEANQAFKTLLRQSINQQREK